MPLLPFLEVLALDEVLRPSRRFLNAIAGRDGAELLRSLAGLYVTDTSANTSEATAEDDPVVSLLRQLPGLRELGLVGLGIDALDLDTLALAEAHGDDNEDETASDKEIPLQLPHLRALSVISLPVGPVVTALIAASLPALRELTVTPYEGVPGAMTSALVESHGPRLDKLTFSSPGGGWPTILHPSPPGILSAYPSISELALCSPVPDLFLSDSLAPTAALRCLTISRPSADLLAALLNARLLPKLLEVQIRDVRWLRAGMAVKAREAGVQGEMREWRRRLARRGVVLLDADGSTGQAAGQSGDSNAARGTIKSRTA